MSSIAKKLTIVIPGYNEEARIAITVEQALQAANDVLDEYEIIIVDDGSTDNMAQVAQGWVDRYPEKISLIRQPGNQGVGAAFSRGLEVARFPWLTLVPGDNAFAQDGVRRTFAAVGSADVIVTYRANMAVRTPLRRLMSMICTTLVRFSTRCPIQDAHSLFVFPVDLVRQALPLPKDYRYHLSSLTYLLTRVNSFRQLPVQLTPRPDASSRVKVKVTIREAILCLKLVTLFRLLGKGRRSPVQEIV